MRFTFNFDAYCPDCNTELPDSWDFNIDQMFICPDCDAQLTIDVQVLPRVVHEDEPSVWTPSSLIIAAKPLIDEVDAHTYVAVSDSEPGGETYMDADAAREIAASYLAAAAAADKINMRGKD